MSGCPRRFLVLLLLGGSFGAFADTAENQEMEPPMATGFLDATLEGGLNPRYVRYVPRDYSPDRPWPLIVFLHGAGERGSDGLLPTEVGLGGAIRRFPERFPALAIFPQCPADRTWEVMLDDVEAMIQATEAAYAVDPDRIYLTGISMGGYGAFLFAAQRPRRYAALMPVCGGAEPADVRRLSTAPPAADAFGHYRDRIAAIAHLPTHIFHGADDTVVPPMRSRQAHRALQNAGAPVHYTEYEGIAHNAWDTAYQDPDNIAWLFEQRRE